MRGEEKGVVEEVVRRRRGWSEETLEASGGVTGVITVREETVTFAATGKTSDLHKILTGSIHIVWSTEGGCSTFCLGAVTTGKAIGRGTTSVRTTTALQRV